MLTNKGLTLKIFFYKTILNNRKKLNKSTILFVKTLKGKVRPEIYSKIIKNLNVYFINILNNFKNSKFKNKNLAYLYGLFQLEKSKFFLIEKFLKKNLTNNTLYKIFLEKVFDHFFLIIYRKRFWSIISSFLLYYLKTYNKNINSIQFLITSGLTIDVVKKYIIIRLKQRFKVTQIITPIIKDLKRRKNILGFKFSFSGRFSRREMATYEWFVEGPVSLSTVDSKIEYRQFPILLKDGICGIKIWINKSLIENKKLGFNQQLIYKS